MCLVITIVSKVRLDLQHELDFVKELYKDYESRRRTPSEARTRR